ncbi:hypothetical protein SNEBB_000763 [Seison nebaliae]|nr:hypothetical protein SNEBB_000763 [Seison nebaliae]
MYRRLIFSIIKNHRRKLVIGGGLTLSSSTFISLTDWKYESLTQFLPRWNLDNLSNTKDNSKRLEEEKKSINNSNDKECVTELRNVEEEFNLLQLFLKENCSIFFLFSGAILFAFTAAYANIQIPMALGEMVNVIITNRNEIYENFEKYLCLISADSLRLLRLYVVQSLSTYGYIQCLSVIGESLSQQFKEKLFDRLILSSIDFYDNRRTATFISTMMSDVHEFKSTLKSILSTGLKSITQSIGCCISLWNISPQLLMTMMGTVGTMVLIGSQIGNSLRKISRRALKCRDSLAVYVDEILSNIRTVRTLNMENYSQNHMSILSHQLKDENVRLGSGIAIFQGLSNLALNGLTFIMVVYGGWLTMREEIDYGQLLSFVTSSQILQKSLIQFSIVYGKLVGNRMALNRIEDLWRDSSETKKRRNNLNKSFNFEEFNGNIRLENVKFSYPSRSDKLILDGINVQVKKGEQIALVGQSGSGKSTICSLIESLYDCDEGTILIDGINVNRMHRDLLRGKLIGYISQEPVLFATTIRENIRYGKSDANENEIKEVAKLANAHDFIQTLPDKYDTIVGERGTKLSGGEKQRIAIARALIKNPKILLLDEATSALDNKSERLVQTALDNAAAGRTLIIIAHRLSTVRNVDRIYVIQKGKIAEVGTHDELLRNKDGVYSSLLCAKELT